MSIIYVYGNQPSGDRCREFHQSPLKIVDAETYKLVFVFSLERKPERIILSGFFFVYGQRNSFVDIRAA